MLGSFPEKDAYIPGKAKRLKVVNGALRVTENWTRKEDESKAEAVTSMICGIISESYRRPWKELLVSKEEICEMFIKGAFQEKKENGVLPGGSKDKMASLPPLQCMLCRASVSACHAV